MNEAKRATALVIEPAGNLWGSERVLLDFLTAARPGHWSVEVCCPPDSLIIPKLAELGIVVHPMLPANLHRRSRIAYALALLRLAYVVARRRVDILYVNQAGATRLALIVGTVLRRPVVTHVRLVEDVEYLLALPFTQRLSAVVCISDYIRRKFPRDIDALRGELITITDLYQQRPSVQAMAPLSQPSRFVCTGRLAPIKGQETLIGAYARLRQERIEASLHFVGSSHDGAYEAKLRRMASDLDVGASVTWHGFQDNVFPLVAGSTAQVCPSLDEPLGRVIFEAWDAGVVPIAWAGSGGPADSIRESGGGILYAAQDSETMADAMQLAIALTPAQREELVAKGRAWLRRHCDPKAYADKMLAVWDRVIRARTRECGETPE